MKISCNKQIPIFVINLKRDVDKKRFMQGQADSLGLEFTFIEAVYGKDLNQEEVDQVCDHKACEKALNRRLFRGEVGIALSQMHIYQKMQDENISEAIIFEDDALLDKSILEVMDSVNSFPPYWEQVLLGYHRHFISDTFYRISYRDKYKLSDKFKLVRFTEVMHGAFGYLINKKGAKKLLDTLNLGLVEPVDHYTGNDEYLNVFGLYPKCVSVNIALGSAINEERHEYWQENKSKNIDGSWKGNLKNKLEKLGILGFIQMINGARNKYYDELCHIPGRLKIPRKYK